jgi:hypothetical protein
MLKRATPFMPDIGVQTISHGTFQRTPIEKLEKLFDDIGKGKIAIIGGW